MSKIHPTALVDPSARLADDVEVGAFSIIDSKVTIGEGSRIGPHVVVTGRTTIGKNTRIFQFASIGEEPFSTSLAIPFFKEFMIPLGKWLFIVFGTFIIVGAGNAVNLTDGLDGLAILPWSPLAGGRLFQDNSARAGRLRETLESVGEQLGGAAIDQVALAWILRHPARIVPVLGTGRVDRVRSAAGAVALDLSREQWFQIWTASAGEPVP